MWEDVITTALPCTLPLLTLQEVTAVHLLHFIVYSENSNQVILKFWFEMEKRDSAFVKNWKAMVRFSSFLVPLLL